jgi:hypothetical protein
MTTHMMALARPAEHSQEPDAWVRRACLFQLKVVRDCPACLGFAK